MYQNILFDLDGTLTDPAEGITNSVAYALEKFGIRVADHRELYPFIGPPLIDSFRKYYGFSEQDGLAAVAYYREYFRDRGIFENRVFDGTKELLDGLKSAGRTVVLATSKPEEFALRILDHFALTDYFDTVAGATMDGRISQKPDVVRYALEKAALTDPEQTVMVGDRKHDIFGATENGLDSVGVLYGYGDRAELTAAGATYLAESPKQVLEICLKE